MSTSLPNDVYSNLIQFPIVFVCCILVPILKTYCCKESRHKLVWRYDVLRHMICNVVSFAFLLAVAMLFEGNDRLNFYTITATDLSLGISLDILMHRALRVGGCEIGNYGDPISFTRFVWHSGVSICVLTMVRSTSAITAIMLFPFTNKQFDLTENYFNDNITIYVLPVLYFITRTLMLDVYNRFDAGYIRVVHDNVRDKTNEETFVIEDDSTENTSTAHINPFHDVPSENTDFEVQESSG